MDDGTNDRLQPHHREELETGSGISPEVIDARGYRSLGLYDMQQRVAREELSNTYADAGGWLDIPITRPDGSHFGSIIRLDRPAIKDDTEQKYIWPLNSHNVIDVHPTVLANNWHQDSDVPLIVTEGIKKADAILSRALDAGMPVCVVAVNGCWGWRAKVLGKGSGSVALPDWNDIALEGRNTIIIPDSDFAINPSVADGWTSFARYMVGKTRSKEHHVSLAVPPGKGLKKQGADDYLLHHSLDDLLGLARHPKAIDLDPIVRELPSKTLQMVWDSADTQVDWVVNRLIGPKSVALFTGHSRALKTWHVQSLALDLCLGQPWTGHGLFYMQEPVKVLHLSEEMTGEDVGERYRKLMLGDRYKDPAKQQQIHDRLTILARSGFTFGDEDYKQALILMLQTTGIQVLLVDSLSMTWDGEENSSSEVKGMYRWIRSIIEETGISVVLIHHLNKPVAANADRDAMFDIRGSVQLVNQADTVVMFANYATFDGRNRQVQVKHIKSWKGMEPESWVSRFYEHDDTTLTVPTAYGDRSYAPIDITFDSLFSENAAHTYATTQDDDAGMEWMMGVIEQQTGYETTGIEKSVLLPAILTYWPRTEGKKPSDTRLLDWLNTLVANGRLARVRRGAGGDSIFAAPSAAVIADLGVSADVGDYGAGE
jgi:hypothetical protein